MAPDCHPPRHQEISDAPKRREPTSPTESYLAHVPPYGTPCPPWQPQDPRRPPHNPDIGCACSDTARSTQATALHSSENYSSPTIVILRRLSKTFLLIRES